MPNFNLPQIVDWAILIDTAPPVPGPGGATFLGRVDIFLANNPNPVPLVVNSVEELQAIIGVLQIPGGRLFFNAPTRGLIKVMN